MANTNAAGINYLADSNASGTTVTKNITDLLSLWGGTPAAQRAAAAQATSLVGTASSTAVDTNLKAAVIEIMNTLAALSAWKGSA